MHAKRHKTLVWKKTEEAFCASRRIPSANDSAAEIYKALYLNWDARKCEALAVSKDRELDPIIRIRALISRGNYVLAAQELQSLIHEIGEENFQHSELAELILEQARIFAFEGNWLKAREVAVAGMSMKPVPVTLTSLLQVASLAEFECGNINQAVQFNDKIQSMKSVFPNGSTPIYSDCLRAKILARDQGRKAALDLLVSCWQQCLKTGNLDKNAALALLRTELDIERYFGEDHFSQASATWHLANSIGDRLYEVLAQIDVSFSKKYATPPFEAEIARAEKEFPRVERLLSEIRAEQPQFLSETAKTVRSYLSADRPSETVSLNQEKIEILYFEQRSFVAQIEPWKILDIKAKPQFSRALNIFKNRNKVSRQDFFKELWGQQKYVPNLHDQTIHALLKRMRKELSLRISCAGEHVCMQGVLVV